MKLPTLLLSLLVPTVAAFGQAGDKAGEEQPARWKDWDVPAAPVLSPAQALSSFTLQDGYRVELVASEPLVNDPIEITFDANGRMWVVEMTGFMPNADGTGERAPIGSIAVLEDENGDGRMDTRRVFMDEMVLPRSITFVPGGVLVLAPPRLLFCQDLDGDGRADQQTLVGAGFGGLENVEHAPNSLTQSLDNWVYLSQHNRRYRFRAGEWKAEPAISAGQWGLAEDDFGRHYFNYNSSPLYCDLVPSHYLFRNPHLGRAAGGNVSVSDDLEVWPGRINPGVNRGYQDQTLRDDGTLHRFTATCGPVIYRGDRFPELVGDGFICEPAGNLIRHIALEEQDGRPFGRNAWPRSEFLTSTDERFRPVNLANGPDGALYVVDMYRGIVQHRVYVTSFLRAQIEERGLAAPLGLGRIYRVVEDRVDRKPAERPRLQHESSLTLVDHLAHPNAWWRQTAQRLLIERGRDAEVIDAIRGVARIRKSPVARLHALWTLEGLSALDEYLLLRALQHDDVKVRRAGLRLSEPLAISPAIWSVWKRLAWSEEIELLRQVALSLGEARHPEASRLLASVLRRAGDDDILRGGAVSGLHEEELEFLRALLRDPRWQREREGHAKLLRTLARCVVKQGDGDRVGRLLTLTADRGEPWSQRAILTGLVDGLPRKQGETLGFAEPEPSAFVALMACDDDGVRDLASRLKVGTTWSQPRVEPDRLDESHLAAVERGKQVYDLTCFGCHQSDGAGIAGLAPPLVDSEWLDLPEHRLAEIVLGGLAGPITVNGKAYDLHMPGIPALSDVQVADVLSYVLHRFGPESIHVEADRVSRVRAGLLGTR